MNRRNFLTTMMTGAAAVGAAAIVRPAISWAQVSGDAPPIKLAIASRTIEVNGRAARVFGLLQPNGVHGLAMDAGAQFNVDL